MASCRWLSKIANCRPPRSRLPKGWRKARRRQPMDEICAQQLASDDGSGVRCVRRPGISGLRRIGGAGRVGLSPRKAAAALRSAKPHLREGRQRSRKLRNFKGCPGRRAFDEFGRVCRDRVCACRARRDMGPDQFPPRRSRDSLYPREQRCGIFVLFIWL